MNKHITNELASNISDVALIIEGGGLRASYTAGAIVTLLERELYFPSVYGISAGSSHAVNYLSRDKRRTKCSFVDFVTEPNFGGWGSFLHGNGYFNSPWIYEGIAEAVAGSDSPYAFDFETFAKNPAQIHIEAFDWESGATVAWTRKDMPTMRDMMLRVRASSSMPIFMPPTLIEGKTYLDGGMGESWGILIDAARRDGYERFFVIRTQPKGYRKSELSAAQKALFRTVFHAHPLVAEKTIERPARYNALCDELERLESAGQAYVFYPEQMPVTNREIHVEKLQHAYDLGYEQAQREACAWERWLA
ncbi:patatin family protein [Eggerthellaceae bacterium 3-80]|nr:patatin family protein [bacterium D16-34]